MHPHKALNQQKTSGNNSFWIYSIPLQDSIKHLISKLKLYAFVSLTSLAALTLPLAIKNTQYLLSREARNPKGRSNTFNCSNLQFCILSLSIQDPLTFWLIADPLPDRPSQVDTLCRFPWHFLLQPQLSCSSPCSQSIL